MPSNNQFNYSGLKVDHSGDWNRQDYHDHNKVHSDKLKKTSEERQFKPKPRSKDFNKPKPTTKILDLATNKAKVVDEGIEKANLNDLKNKGLK